MARHYRQHDLQMLIGGAVAGLEQSRDLIDWFDHCARLSERSDPRPAVLASPRQPMRI